MKSEVRKLLASKYFKTSQYLIPKKKMEIEIADYVIILMNIMKTIYITSYTAKTILIL